MNLVNHERQHSGLFPILAIFAVALMVSACSTTGGIVPAATTKSGFDGAVFKGETIEPLAKVGRIFLTAPQ